MALILGGTSWLFHLQSLTINTVRVSGNVVVTQKAIVDAANAILSGNFLWLFPKDNVLIYPKHALANALLSDFPRLMDVTVSTQFPHSVQIAVEERQTSALWCGTSIADPSTATTTDCYTMDPDGYVFAPVTGAVATSTVMYYGALHAADGATSTEAVGSYFLTPDTYHVLRTFISSLAQDGMPGRVVTEGSHDDWALALESGGEVRFNTTVDLDQTLRDIMYAVNAKEQQYGSSIFTSSLQYIDARFADTNKVYFKFSS